MPCFQERLARIESDVREEESRQRQEAEIKKQQIEEAERKRRVGSVEDESQLVDDMFNFIDQQTEGSMDGAGPAAFKVWIRPLL